MRLAQMRNVLLDGSSNLRLYLNGVRVWPASGQPSSIAGHLYTHSTPVVCTASGPTTMVTLPTPIPAGAAAYVIASFSGTGVEPTAGQSIVNLTQATREGWEAQGFELMDTNHACVFQVETDSGYIWASGIPASAVRRTWEFWVQPRAGLSARGSVLTGDTIGEYTSPEAQPSTFPLTHLTFGHRPNNGNPDHRWVGTLHRCAVFTAVPEAADRALLTAWANDD